MSRPAPVLGSHAEDAAAHEVPPAATGAALTIEELQPARTGQFLALLGAYLGPEAERRYRWLYRDNPHGPARTFVARSGDELCGCTSLFPRRVALGPREIPAALGGDAFVLPAYRRRGLAQALHGHSLRALGETPRFMFGPPAPANLRVLQRVGARPVRTLRHFTAVLRGEFLSRWLAEHAPPRGALGFLQRQARARASLLAQAVDTAARLFDRATHARATPAPRPLVPLTDADERFDALWTAWQAQQAASGAGATVTPVRDRAYLRWRFLAQPGRCVSLWALPAAQGAGESDAAPAEARPLAGYAVLEHGRRHLWVHDLLALSRRDARALLIGLRALAAQAGLEAVTLRLDPDGPFVAAALTAGYLPSRRGVVFQVLAPTGTPLLDECARAPWLFSLGDEDNESLEVLTRPGAAMPERAL